MCFLGSYLKTHCQDPCQKACFLFSPRIFMVSLYSILNWFLWIVIDRSLVFFLILHVNIWFSQHHLLKRLLFLHWVFLANLSNIRWLYIHGQGSLAYCSPWGHKESDMTERLNWTDNITWNQEIWHFLFCCFSKLLWLLWFHLNLHRGHIESIDGFG